MKNNKSAKESSITDALLKGLINTKKAAAEKTKRPPLTGSKPLKPSDLFQDSGGAYNPIWIIPQE